MVLNAKTAEVLKRIYKPQSLSTSWLFVWWKDKELSVE